MRKVLTLLVATSTLLLTSCESLEDLFGDFGGEKDDTEQSGGDGSEGDENLPYDRFDYNVVVVHGIDHILAPTVTSFTLTIASSAQITQEDIEMMLPMEYIEQVTLERIPGTALEDMPWGYAVTVQCIPNDSYEVRVLPMRLGEYGDYYDVLIAPAPNYLAYPSLPSVGIEGGFFDTDHVFYLAEQYEEYGLEEVYWCDDEDVVCPTYVDGEYTALEIGPNPTLADREIIINVGLRDAEGAVAKVDEYTVYQEGGVVMQAPRATYVAPNSTTQIEIPINANVDFEVSISSGWVSILEQTPSSLKINVDGYHGEASRKTTITLTNAANNVACEIKVIQFPHAITTVHLDEPGTLSTKFTLNEMLDTEHLQITGEMDNRDFETLKKFTTLTTIDISGVELPDNMLPERAFDDMLLENIILPSNLRKIGRMAFGDNPVLESVDIPVGVTYMDEATFYGCSSLKSIKLPLGITIIGDAMFEKCESLTEIDIPEGVVEIGSAAFRNCTSLRRVGIPSSLQLFDFGRDSYNYDYGYQFYGCKSLKEISFPSQINYIPSYCFAECDSLESVTIDNVETLRTSAFENCKSLKEVKMSRVTSIYDSAFQGCTALETVTCPIIHNIGHSAFADCSALKEFTFPKTLKSLNGYVFSNCVSLSRIEIPKSVTEIGYGVFNGCHGLTAAYIYATILSLPERMFYKCDNLLYLELPEKLKTVENDAFDYVHALLVLKLNSTSTTPLTGEGLDGLQRFRIDLLVDKTVEAVYKDDEFWGSCRKINDSTTETPESAFWDEYVADRDFWDDFIQEN